MELWFLRDPARLLRERAALEVLSRHEWLHGCDWLFHEGRLCVEAVVAAGGSRFRLRLTFPVLFPLAPIVVTPLGEASRLSSHQYGGADGPLCLEWGPDNWHGDITSADMLESARRLLEIENPRGSQALPSFQAPTRHLLNVGQELRGSWLRWYCADALLARFLAAAPARCGSFSFSFREAANGHWVGLLHEVGTLDGTTWADSQTVNQPPEFRPGRRHTGAWFSTDAPATAIEAARSIADLKLLLQQSHPVALLERDGSSPVPGLDGSICGFVVLDADREPHLFVALSDDTVTRGARVRSERALVEGWPTGATLATSLVGVVGLGSAGSKVAASLARMGVRRFHLIDHDLMLPENVARHALDWRAVALHKVEGVRASLQAIAPDCEVSTSAVHLTGQESNAVVNGQLERLGQCDVLVDATANAGVFNLLAGVSQIFRRSLIWLEVFAGGVGGLVARSRVGTDASPQQIRHAYLQFCEAHPAPAEMRVGANYGQLGQADKVLSASDADVGVVAHHAARLVAECLQPSDAISHPHCLYLIGLAKGWIFSQPFDTVPIVVERVPAPAAVVDDQTALEGLGFIADLLAKAKQ